MGVEEGHEDRLLHQFVGQLDGDVEKLRMRRGVDGGLAEDVVAHVAGHVDLARRAGEDVCRQESLPQHAQVLAFGTIDVGGRVFAQLVGDCFKGLAVPLGLEGEFKSFETVVLRKVGHECAESVRGRSGVGEDLFQRRAHRTVSAPGNGKADRSGTRRRVHLFVEFAIGRGRSGRKFGSRAGSVIPKGPRGVVLRLLQQHFGRYTVA